MQTTIHRQDWVRSNEITDVPYRWYHEIYQAWTTDRGHHSENAAMETADAMLRTLAEIRALTEVDSTERLRLQDGHIVAEKVYCDRAMRLGYVDPADPRPYFSDEPVPYSPHKI